MEDRDSVTVSKARPRRPYVYPAEHNQARLLWAQNGLCALDNTL